VLVLGLFVILLHHLLHLLVLIHVLFFLDDPQVVVLHDCEVGFLALFDLSVDALDLKPVSMHLRLIIFELRHHFSELL